MTTDIDYSGTGASDGVWILSNNITLDGNGHAITGFNRSANTGVNFSGRNGVTVKNLNISEFSTGIYFNSAGTTAGNVVSGNWVFDNQDGVTSNGSSNNQITGNMIFWNDSRGINAWSSSDDNEITNNYLYSQTYGIFMGTGDNNSIAGNTIVNNDMGLEINGSNNSIVVFNNFSDNTIFEARVFSGAGNNFMYNYWSDYDSPSEGCLNTSPFDFACDDPYSGPGFSDNITFLWAGGWNSFYSTWYDNVGGDNWILSANPDSTTDIWADLKISGYAFPLPALPGYARGQIPPGAIITPQYFGTMGGPVILRGRSLSPVPIVSQRTLWPKGGDSFEEVPGISALDLSDQYWWTWYDMQSPGYKDWVLISNPNSFDVDAVVVLAGELIWNDVVPAGGQTNLQFPGEMGGPLMVRGYVGGSSDPANIIASQRVLSNGDTAFNELPGIPADNLSSDYLWTWYDMTGSAQNWVMIANPDINFPDEIYYQVRLGGSIMANGGPIAAGDTEATWFPGTIGGPVEVLTSFDAAHHLPAPSVVSQRSLWGPSFEEVPGTKRSGLQSSHYWTWYDEHTPGSQNWILIANPSATETITAYISFVDQVSGLPQLYLGVIEPGGRWTPHYPGRMGGPVKVWAYLYGTTTARPVLTSQRVLWNGYFNEVWGQ